MPSASASSQQDGFQGFTPPVFVTAQQVNMSPSGENYDEAYIPNIYPGPGTPRVTPPPPRTISLTNKKTFGKPEEDITGVKRRIPLPSDSQLTPGGKKSRKKNTKRSVNRVRRTKLRKTKKVNKTKLRKTKKNKK